MTCQDLVRQNPERPDVQGRLSDRQLPFFFLQLSEHLWGSVIGGEADCPPLAGLLSTVQVYQFPCHAVREEHHVGWLHVAVNDSLGVDISQSGQNLHKKRALGSTLLSQSEQGLTCFKHQILSNIDRSLNIQSLKVCPPFSKAMHGGCPVFFVLSVCKILISNDIRRMSHRNYTPYLHTCSQSETCEWTSIAFSSFGSSQ